VAAPLEVLLDDTFVALLGGIDVGAEGADAEPAAQRAPEEALLIDREAVELVDVDYLVGLVAQVRLLKASRTTGSICSTPSTRSSRFSFPVQRTNASSSSPS
jgi:hypothetical protein